MFRMLYSLCEAALLDCGISYTIIITRADLQLCRQRDRGKGKGRKAEVPILPNLHLSMCFISSLATGCRAELSCPSGALAAVTQGTFEMQEFSHVPLTFPLPSLVAGKGGCQSPRTPGS